MFEASVLRFWGLGFQASGSGDQDSMSLLGGCRSYPRAVEAATAEATLSLRLQICDLGLWS